MLRKIWKKICCLLQKHDLDWTTVELEDTFDENVRCKWCKQRIYLLNGVGF